jgi:hypothetical protein
MTKSTKIRRKPVSGTFVLGARAFRKISAVEGIELSHSLDAELARTSELPASKRRTILSEKYGGKNR